MSTPAAAQSERTFVANTGTDVGVCGPAAACRTLAYAYGNTSAGGEIIVRNSGTYGTVTLGRSITIRADGAPVAVVGVIFVTAAPGDHVVIEGLDFGGRDNNSDVIGLLDEGVKVTQAGDVVIANCQFRNFTVAGVILSMSSGSGRVTISNALFSNDVIGVQVSAGPGRGHVKLFDSLFVGNAIAGVQVTGAGNDVLLSGNKILGSAKAIDLQSGGTATSYGNNVLTNGDKPVTMPQG